MVPKAVLILPFLYCLNANAQDQPLADNFIRTARADTSALPLDSTALSRLAYQIAYGSRDNRILWSIAEHIDSARINVVVRNVLAGQDGSIQIRSLEPAFEPYQKLRYHVDSLLEAKMDSLVDWNQISRTFNEYRLMNRAAGQVLVQVNIPSATLRVFGKQGNVLLECPVIVGSPSTPTPAFTAYLTRVITYPYWNVPRSIATKEFLPKIKRDPSGFLNSMKLQVLNEEGIVIDPRNIDWKKVSRKNFTYRLRQSTGCDNALGLIKFDLDSPYDIYLHDTNHRELFGADYRFLSHGCIRVAQPVKLANLLMQREFLPDTFTQEQYYNINPRIFPLPEPVPLIITYATVEVEGPGGLRQYRDIYNRIKPAAH